MLTKYILYSCPVGPLAAQIDHYYERARRVIGPNPAHEYMPHISLTGFFPDATDAATTYITGLEALLADWAPTQPTPVLTITNVRLDERFHGLELASPWLKTLTAAFAQRIHSPTRPEAIRCKDWLHLSFAYGFPPEQHAPLVQLAQSLIDPHAPVQWELRFYERAAAHDWVCHGQWPL